MEFSGKVALVTGTTGIGLACAMRLAEGGAKVLACGIDTKANAALARDAAAGGLAVQTRNTDVAIASEVEAAVAEAVSRFGGLDIIINSAAVHPYGTVVSTSGEMSAAITRAPSFANSSAVARPMPLAPPVMIAVLPSSLFIAFPLALASSRTR